MKKRLIGMLLVLLLFVSSALLVLLLFASSAAAENYYVDVIVCADPPPGLEWPMFAVQVLVWDDAKGLGNWSFRKLVLMLGQWWSAESRHSLRGNPTSWSAAIGRGSQRVRNYDTGLWYNIKWGHTGSYNNSSISNVTALHPRFTWKLDPSY